MFKKKDEIKYDQTPFSIEPEDVKTSSTDTKPATKDRNTIFGQNISIEGSIRGEENIIIEGSIKGEVELEKHDFIVGSEGRFEGDIRAQNVNISGLVIGKVITKGKVELTKEADFIGDIRAKNFLMAEGAYFKGSIELDREPNRKELRIQKETPIQDQPATKDSSHKSD
ncbi:MAG TPA: polymer-forming cytoskeletal protein [Deltaproteobacteria bacterium]|nr:polymer-forming cytoskeletal protein [Deltaproteobacteria bacterium]